MLNQGKDDLRQDAVMQQVFGMVNQLLKENGETRKRDLRIKTYKVYTCQIDVLHWVPMSAIVLGANVSQYPVLKQFDRRYIVLILE